MHMIELLFGVLLTYRVALLLTHDALPFGAGNAFRQWAGVRHDEHGNPHGVTLLGDILACFHCTSVWCGWGAGALFALLMADASPHWLLTGLAYSGGAIVLYEVTHGAR